MLWLAALGSTSDSSRYRVARDLEPTTMDWSTALETFGHSAPPFEEDDWFGSEDEFDWATVNISAIRPSWFGQVASLEAIVPTAVWRRYRPHVGEGRVLSLPRLKRGDTLTITADWHWIFFDVLEREDCDVDWPALDPSDTLDAWEELGGHPLKTYIFDERKITSRLNRIDIASISHVNGE